MKKMDFNLTAAVAIQQDPEEVESAAAVLDRYRLESDPNSNFMSPS